MPDGKPIGSYSSLTVPWLLRMQGCYRGMQSSFQLLRPDSTDATQLRIRTSALLSENRMVSLTFSAYRPAMRNLEPQSALESCIAMPTCPSSLLRVSTHADRPMTLELACSPDNMSTFHMILICDAICRSIDPSISQQSVFKRLFAFVADVNPHLLCTIVGFDLVTPL